MARNIRALAAYMRCAELCALWRIGVGSVDLPHEGAET